MRLGLQLALALVCATRLRAETTAPAPVARPVAHQAPAVPVCATIAEAAKAHDLPTDYFTRLIWRESRFHANALSPAGAQGMAQFMPSTAAERGLADPYAVHEALMHSAAFLAELRAGFGNLGLAAAAYNAGPGRVTRWLAGETSLPQETSDYVLAVTGREADAWRAKPPPPLHDDAGFDCARYAILASRAPDPPHAGPGAGAPSSKPWAVILIGSPQREQAMNEYRQVRGRFSGIIGGMEPNVVRKRISGMQVPRYVVQIERESRSEANALCGRLVRAGGNCFVLANRS